MSRTIKGRKAPGDTETGFCMRLHLSDEECWHGGIDGDENGNHRFPDYLNDLNAMAGAEHTLTHEKAFQFGRQLCFKVLGTSTSSPDANLIYWEVALVARATAAQRAEAFLRTLNLWTDTTATVYTPGEE